jgi:signal transduction histidine kinase
MSATTSIARSWTRRLPRAPLAADGAVALVAFALTLALLAAHRANRGLDPLGVVLAALTCVPLLARRRAPLTAFASSTAASAALGGLGYALGPPFGATAALFFVAADARTPPRIRQVGTVAVGLFALHVGATASAHHGVPASALLFGPVVWGGTWIAGDQLRQRRARFAELEERARRAEHERARERRLAAAEERMRIARDLHDSAAHAINVILVQAGAARLLGERDPAAARVALGTIEDVARETIGEIDQLVRGLREERNGAAPTGVEPPAGLAALDALVARHRAAGLALELRVDGPRRPLAPSLDQAAYRIVQESLTNAARHGDGRAAVAIAYGERELELRVVNPVGAEPNGAPGEHGHGIPGMRERAALLGGSLELERGGGRFLVRARLPYAVGGAPS